MPWHDIETVWWRWRACVHRLLPFLGLLFFLFHHVLEHWIPPSVSLPLFLIYFLVVTVASKGRIFFFLKSCYFIFFLLFLHKSFTPLHVFAFIVLGSPFLLSHILFQHLHPSSSFIAKNSFRISAQYNRIFSPHCFSLRRFLHRPFQGSSDGLRWLLPSPFPWRFIRLSTSRWAHVAFQVVQLRSHRLQGSWLNDQLKARLHAQHPPRPT
mmetsp:Transcript_46615/g.117397  ORF Transcript_46615/g.117397 Transcript_46615/m.117397 type:complete len:210 (-) Transcript_46615:56-685(-)